MPYSPPNARVPCTIYVRITRGTGTAAEVKILRRVLQNCVIKAQGNDIALRTGTVLDSSTFVMVFNDPVYEYINMHEWNKLGSDEEHYENYWSVIFGSQTNSIIVPYVADIEPPPTWFANSTAATNWESQNFINAATAIPSAGRIVGRPEEHIIGATSRSQHILIRF